MTGDAKLREVLLVGSLPLTPAEAVYELVSEHLGSLPRMPDGEQAGWAPAVWDALAASPAVEVSERRILSEDRPVELVSLRLKPGCRVEDIELGALGVARSVGDSYGVFSRMKAEGVIEPGTRFQATMPGPAMTVSAIDLDSEARLRLGERALAAELVQILELIPHDELTIQLDLPHEVEVDEYFARPDDFAAVQWRFEAMRGKAGSFDERVDSVARVAEQVPQDVELGFHLCSIWHLDESGGQDNQVHVDWANALTRRIGRRIDYIHMPVVPEHREAELAPLKQLRLGAETTIYLGLIHGRDGLEGAHQRIRAASTVLDDFGVGHYCGLGYHVGTASSASKAFDLYMTLPEMLDLHKQVAAGS
jgi:hypothetical protein